MNTIHIAASREYDVLIGHGLLDELGTLAAGVVDAKTAAIVSDDSVFALYGKRAAAALERGGFRVVSFVFPNGESSKNLTVYGHVLNFLCENRVSRTDVVVGGSGGLRRRNVSARHPLHPGANDAAGHGRFVRRRQDRR